MGTTQGIYKMLSTNPESRTPQNSSYMATYVPSHKPSKLDEQDMFGTASKVGTNSLVTSSSGFLHTDLAVKTYVY